MGVPSHLVHAVTLEEWRAMNLTRPLTDAAIGATTDGRRTAGAVHSEMFTEPDTAINRQIARQETKCPPTSTPPKPKRHAPAPASRTVSTPAPQPDQAPKPPTGAPGNPSA